jgi:hypothetical protein
MTSSNASAGAGFCAACGAALSAGARFCHRCGTPMGQGLPAARQAPVSGAAAVLPWGVAFVAMLALIAMVAGRNFGAAKGSGIDGSANSLPTAEIDGPAAGAPAGGAPFAGSAGGAAPDIANMSPSDRANRLYSRIMTYAEAGAVDSVAFFSPMALASQEMLESPTADERYHFGRIGEVANNPEIAKAQADTILQGQADHLLGLVLAARAARMTKNESAARAFDQRLLRALSSQLATQSEEYVQHRAEIDRAVAEAQQKQ